MSIIAWIVLGLIAGFIASQIANQRGAGMLLDILLGIIGAIVGGWLLTSFGAHDVMRLDLYSLIGSVIGAGLVPLIYHALTGARPASRL
jgi:uncharacterized membrane protein YeaQ/YmgE (transglycosylase-associated protein family)